MSTEASFSRSSPLSPVSASVSKIRPPPRPPPRSRDRKRRAVIRLLTDPNWLKRSDGVLAREARVSQPFVSKIRRQLSQNVLSPQPASRRGADGILRDTTNIGPCIHDSHEQTTRLLAEIKRLGKDFPKYRASIDEIVRQLREKFSRNPESDRHLVLRAIHCGAWTREELLEDTGIPPKALKQILDKLILTKTIITGKKKQTDTTGGPPQILYLPGPIVRGK